MATTRRFRGSETAIEFIEAIAATAGVSLSQFVLEAALARAAYERARLAETDESDVELAELYDAASRFYATLPH